MMSKTYTLYIKAYTPETIPLVRLAKYMENLAALLGHEAGVHFHALRPGSTQIVSRVNFEDEPKVAAHLALIERGEGQTEAKRAQAEIDRLLAEDNATGFVYEDDKEDAAIIAFPGVTRPHPTIYGPFNQEGSLDGILISVGGADQTVHLQLQNGDVKYTGIETNRETARRLAKHMYEPVRVFGTGRWLREEEGNWLLRKFRVDTYQILAADSLRAVIDQMRAVQGSEWQAMENPIGTLKTLREKSGGLH